MSNLGNYLKMPAVAKKAGGVGLYNISLLLAGAVLVEYVNLVAKAIIESK